MYEDLIKELRKESCGAKTTSWWRAADAIEELTDRNVGKWIPVTERLPNEKDRYLTVSIEPWFGTTVVDTMRWSGAWMYDGRETDATVTHWMPLLTPPKEETE